MVENITSSDEEQVEKENPSKVVSSKNYQKRGKKNTRKTGHAAEQWIQVLVDILAEGVNYGVTALPVNFKGDSALIRLPGIRVCSGSGSGRHLVFSRNMTEDGNLCVECQKGIIKDDAKS